MTLECAAWAMLALGAGVLGVSWVWWSRRP